MDTRTSAQKRREWLKMLLENPTDALALLRIDRHPPMVAWEYDDSDDWPGKRWRRALALHRGEQWSTRQLIVIPKPEAAFWWTRTYPELPVEIPRFLLKEQPSKI